jgi:hypothetical protein
MRLMASSHEFACVSLLQFNIKAAAPSLLWAGLSLLKLLDGGHLRIHIVSQGRIIKQAEM